MTPVRIGIIGMGNAGRLHLRALQDGMIPGASLAAVACRSARRAEIAGLIDPRVVVFDQDQLLFDSGLCDAVIIATPHPLHPAQTLAALRAGMHVMCEKPAGVYAAQARTMASAAQASGLRYALNFNRRVVPLYATLRELVRNGTIGTLRRASWTSTSWLRVQAYFETSSWRGTWAGEGGGLLVNQWPHILDIWQWILGMPARLWAYCGFGKHHSIEVEDDVQVVAEYPNGALMTLTGSTGEAPGIERLEIIGDRATIIVEGNQITVTHLDVSVDEFIRTAPPGFDLPNTRTEVRQFDDPGDLIAGITRDFVARINDDAALLAPGQDGIASLELANAILLSSWQGGWINLPLDDAAFHRQLADRIARSGTRAREAAQVMDLRQSFSARRFQ